MCHIAKNLAALAVIQRESKIKKFRPKKRTVVNMDSTDIESERAEGDSADDFDNSKKSQVNSPTLKHKCNLADCTRNFATLRLLQKHQSLNHKECFESNASTPTSQDVSLTPRGSRKKQKLSAKADRETLNMDDLQSGLSTNTLVPFTPIPSLDNVQAPMPTNDPTTSKIDAQISAESKQMQEEAKTLVEHPAVALVDTISDDEHLNDDE
ncbi:hypothetical protein HDU81_001948 [Chytriomyces hyalinus]|nr:hypothetical protein HDU81_001943 [Chytriomyces hyalinus]KAJ3233885.1 hypothetical protein HDU81_001948 [Chytriomyces hyalinus]